MFIDADLDELMILTSSLIRWGSSGQFFVLKPDDSENHLKVMVLFEENKPLFRIEPINSSNTASWQSFIHNLDNKNLNISSMSTEHMSVALPMKLFENEVLAAHLKTLYRSMNISKVDPRNAGRIFMFSRYWHSILDMFLAFSVAIAVVVFIFHQSSAKSFTLSLSLTNISTKEAILITLIIGLKYLRKLFTKLYRPPLAKKYAQSHKNLQTGHKNWLSDFITSTWPIWIMLITSH